MVYTEQDKFKKIEFSAIEKNKPELPKAANNGWVGMIQHYFVTAWVPQGGRAARVLRAHGRQEPVLDRHAAAAGEPGAAGAASTTTAQLYVGPQDQNALAKIAPGLDLVVDYGWLTFLAKPIYWLLEFLHGIVGNWGWAIVLLTVLIKAAFYPLSAASYKSMARMKEVTPRMMKLREQYGDDKQKLNTAMMELYKTEKINPLGGCLPILVQIPVFISLYWVLLASVEMRNAPWILWVKDLATPDPWFILPRADDGHDVDPVQAEPDAARSGAGQGDDVHAAHLRRHVLLLPGRPGAVLARQQHPVDRAAVVRDEADREGEEAGLTGADRTAHAGRCGRPGSFFGGPARQARSANTGHSQMLAVHSSTRPIDRRPVLGAVGRA